MSLFPTYFGWSGAYGWGVPIAEEAKQAPDPEAKAKPQGPLDRKEGGYVGGTDYRGPTAFSKAPAGTLDLYWHMRRYSACVLAYAVTTAPIFAGTRTLEIRKDDGEDAPPKSAAGLYASEGPQESPEDKLKAKLERHFDPLWSSILNGLECLNLGLWLQEVLWDRVDGMTLPVRFKDFRADDLIQNRVRVLQSNGDFAGIKFGNEERDPRYVLHHVHQPHLDPLFGYPRAENARDEWYRAYLTNGGIERAQDKATGISLLLLVDHNYDFRDAAGNHVNAAVAQQTIANALSRGGIGSGPRYTWDKDVLKERPELAKDSPITAQQFDWGSTAPAILSLIGLLDARDARIMRCWRRPEREAMEGKHGTKAEAGVQGAIGTLDCEQVHAERMAQVNCQVIDALLVTNKGPGWKGRLHWKATPLADPQQQFLQDVAKLEYGQPGSQLAAMTKWQNLAKRVEVPVDENYRPVPPLPDGTMQGVDTTAGMNGNANGGGGASANGNGRVNGNNRLRPFGLSGDDEEDYDGGRFVPGRTALSLNCGTGAGGFQSGNTCAGGGAAHESDPHLSAAHAYAADVNARVAQARTEATAAAKQYAADVNAKYAELRKGKPGEPETDAEQDQQQADAEAAIGHAVANLPEPLRPMIADDVARSSQADQLAGGDKLRPGEFREAVDEYVNDAANDAVHDALEAVPAEYRPFVAAHQDRVSEALSDKGRVDPAKAFAENDDGTPHVPAPVAQRVIESANAAYAPAHARYEAEEITEDEARSAAESAYRQAAKGVGGKPGQRLRDEAETAVEEMVSDGALPHDFFVREYAPPEGPHGTLLSADLSLDCGTGAGGFKAGNKCQKPGAGGRDSKAAVARPVAPDKRVTNAASPAEWVAAKKQARAKVAAAPVPPPDKVAKMRAALERAKVDPKARAGGDARGSAADRRSRARRLFTEFGGDDKGYVVCHGTGKKLHWTADPAENPKGYEKFEQGKIFTAHQGGGYQMPNLLPESFMYNRGRNDAILRPENTK